MLNCCMDLSLYNSSVPQCFTSEVSDQSTEAVGLNKVYCLQGLLCSLSLVIVAEDNLTLSGIVPHTGAICPTDLSTAALANWKLTLNTAWLVVHSPYVSLHISAMKRNLWCLLCLDK